MYFCQQPLPVVERQRGRATAQRNAQAPRDRTPPGAILRRNADLSNLPGILSSKLSTILVKGRIIL